jgi:hypothetical protein
MTNYADDYFAEIERLTGRPEDGNSAIQSSRRGLPPVYVSYYRDWPVEGVLTAFTLGDVTNREPRRGAAAPAGAGEGASFYGSGALTFTSAMCASMI